MFNSLPAWLPCFWRTNRYITTLYFQREDILADPMNSSNIQTTDPILSFLLGVFLTLSLIVFLNFHFPHLVQKSLDFTHVTLDKTLNSIKTGTVHFRQWLVAVSKLPQVWRACAKKWFLGVVLVMIIKALRCCLQRLEMMLQDSVLFGGQHDQPEAAAAETSSPESGQSPVPYVSPSESDSQSAVTERRHLEQPPAAAAPPPPPTRAAHEPRTTSAPSNSLPQFVDEIDLFDRLPFYERSALQRRILGNQPAAAATSNANSNAIDTTSNGVTVSRKEPAFTYYAGQHSMVRSASPCSICLEEFSYGARLRSLNCGHVFHVGCIDNWLVYQSTCPYRCS